MLRQAASPIAALLAAALATTAHAAPLDISLTFGSLPSAQGFTYVATGAHTGVPEASVFSVDGTLLTEDTINQYIGTSGAGLFYQRLNGITTTEPKQIRVSARCDAYSGSSVYPVGQGGFCFLFSQGTTQYGFTVTPAYIGVFTGGNWVLSSTLFNNTQFHDYVFDWQPGGAWQLYRDAVLEMSGSGGGASATNRILLGDSTGGANARADIRAYRFIQDTATPAAATTWGRIKGLYR